MNERGKYVVIEGIDATGKSTQVEMTRRWLATKAIDSVEFHEPAGAPIADELRTVIKNGDLERDAVTNVLLFTASRRETWRQIGQPALKMGRWAVAARNWYSTQVYQGNAEGVSFKDIEETTRRYMPADYLHPDLTIMLTLGDEAVRAQRIHDRGVLENPDTFESRDACFQQRLHEGYEKVAQIHPMRVVDASSDAETVQAAIRELIKPLVSERQGRE